MYSSYRTGYGQNTAYAQPQSGLEAAVNSYAAATQQQQPYVISQAASPPAYTTADKDEPKLQQRQEVIYHYQPVAFLSPSRPKTAFVAEAATISDFIKEAFRATTGSALPENITITVAPRAQLQMVHGQFFNSSVVGLSFNSSAEKHVFAVAGSLDEVMLVIGHELGHVLTPTLPGKKAEEAKAFAFELAWAGAIFRHDVAGLKTSINEAALGMKPAQNGLHDAAFALVQEAARAGKEPLAIHSELSEHGEIQPSIAYIPLAGRSHASYHSHGYLNRSSVQNVPWMTNFSWADLGTGIYGMYIPMTASIFMNERLLRSDLGQFHKTLGHEYILHHVMKLPDGYVAKILEETIFWEKEDDKSSPV